MLVPMTGARVLGVAYRVARELLSPLRAAYSLHTLHHRRIFLDGRCVPSVSLERPVRAVRCAPTQAYLAQVRQGLNRFYDGGTVNRYLDHAVSQSKAPSGIARLAATPAGVAREHGIAFRRLFPWALTQSAPFGAGWVVLQPAEATVPDCHYEEEAFIILAGEGVAVADDSEAAVVKGDTCYFSPFVTHVVKNTGRTQLEVLCVWWPSAIPGGTPTADVTQASEIAS